MVPKVFNLLYLKKNQQFKIGVGKKGILETYEINQENGAGSLNEKPRYL